jgi:phage terminase large subunit GpA-like protein
MIHESLIEAIEKGLAAAIPDGDLSISEWAENYRFLPPERAAAPGPWRNNKTPYLVEIMDAPLSPDCREIVFRKSSQIGGTEAINNILGYFMHIDPSNILFFAENEEKVEAWSKECLAPLIRDTPVLKELVADPKSRDSNNTIKLKSFPGGNLVMASAGSPASLSSRPRRIILGDEIDAMENTKEGDPLKLAEARTKTYKDQAIHIYVSSPRNAETSRIEPMFQDSTREFYFVPCLDCDEYQILKWANVRWDEGEPQDAYYVCDHCGVQIDHDDKEEMLARGEWRSMNPEYVGYRRGFAINEIYSPWSTWGDIATAFLKVKMFPDQLKTFVNTRLGEVWEAEGEKIEYADIAFNREEYEAEVPDGVLLLTAGVDTQGDRLECEILGWGMDRENWSIGYKVFLGDPGKKGSLGRSKSVSHAGFCERSG